MKKLLSTTLLALCAAALFAQNEDDFQVLQKPDNMITITGYSGQMPEVAIPASIHGQPVNEIGGNAFAGNTTLRGVVIPGSVAAVGNSAFAGCANLSSVTLSTGLLSVGDSAFSSCALTAVELPEGLLSIGNAAFAGNKIRAAALPNSVTRVGVDAFSRNPELSEILLGSGIENVFFNAFGSGENPLSCIAVRKSGVALGAIGLDQSFVNVYNTGGAGVYTKRGSVWVKETTDPAQYTPSAAGRVAAAPSPSALSPRDAAAPPPQIITTTPGDVLPPLTSVDYLGSQWVVYFPANKTSFDGLRGDVAFSNRRTLEDLVEILKEFSSLRVRIIGYTNPLRPSTNEIRTVLQPLSEQRAETVAQLLNFYGIARGRMIVRGAGAGDPIASFARRSEWHLNRRVEVTIIR